MKMSPIRSGKKAERKRQPGESEPSPRVAAKTKTQGAGSRSGMPTAARRGGACPPARKSEVPTVPPAYSSHDNTVDLLDDDTKVVGGADLVPALLERLPHSLAGSHIKISVQAAEEVHVENARGIGALDGVRIGIVHGQHAREVLCPQLTVCLVGPQSVLPAGGRRAPGEREGARGQSARERARLATPCSLRYPDSLSRGRRSRQKQRSATPKAA